MSWIKSLWDKVVNKTSTSPTLTLVEEVEEIEEPVEEKLETVPEILERVLLEAGISKAIIERLDILEVFDQWYEGPPAQADIEDSLQSFKKAMGGAINAKLNKIK
tara:strand:- start:544 stop:858 length:315 start_codon:yes stop_codon:yes gene_type:complete